MENYSDTNECTSRGACSTAPNISALQELIYTCIFYCSYYINCLENMGGSNTALKKNIIEDLGALVSVGEFDDKELYRMLIREFQFYQNTFDTYKKMSKNDKFEYMIPFEFDLYTPISKAISIGQNIISQDYIKDSLYEKSLRDILILLLKGVSLNLVKLDNFGQWDEIACNSIFNVSEKLIAKDNNYKELISKISKINVELQEKLIKSIRNEYGNSKKIKVSHSTKKGKAILVSGSSLSDLQDILEDTKNKNIDVYTSSTLLVAHSFEKFGQYDNLIGHYGDIGQNPIKDFATFPGAILLTKNFGCGNEYLYRGRLYSNASIVPAGVSKIVDRDYAQMIKETLTLKGFKNGKVKPDEEIGFCVEELEKKLDKIQSKIESGELKTLYVISMNSYLTSQKEYFTKFFSSLNKDEFAIAFSSSIKNKNVYSINTANFIPINFEIFEIINCKIKTGKVIYIYTTCDASSITSIIMLKKQGCQDIYCSSCPPTFIPPSSLKTLMEEYNIKSLTSDPQNDLKMIRKT